MRSAAPPRLHLGRRQRRDHRPRTARQRGAAHCRPSPPRQPQPRADAQRRLARAPRPARRPHQRATARTVLEPLDRPRGRLRRAAPRLMETPMDTRGFTSGFTVDQAPDTVFAAICNVRGWWSSSEEHTSELQSLMRISYAVVCLKNKKYIETHKYSSIKFRTNTKI